VSCLIEAGKVSDHVFTQGYRRTGNPPRPQKFMSSPASSSCVGTLSKEKPLTSIRALNRRQRRTKAQTTVEFSLILLPFLAILFAIIDYAQIYYYTNALQNGMREASRFATAGRIIQNGTNYETVNGVTVPQAISVGASEEASRYDCIKDWFQTNCVLAIPPGNIAIYSASVPTGQPPLVSTNNGVLHLMGGYSYVTNGAAVTTNMTSPADGPGAANDYVQIIATYHVNTITPIFEFLGGYDGRAMAGGYPVRVSAIVKNEPAYLNFQHTAINPGETNAPSVK
jgi:Flp pilus assembly protein TadG